MAEVTEVKDVTVAKEEVLKKIDGAYEKLYTIWHEIKDIEEKQIKKSWIDDVGRAYVAKLMEVNHKFNLLLDELTELKDNWAQYLKAEEKKTGEGK